MSRCAYCGREQPTRDSCNQRAEMASVESRHSLTIARLTQAGIQPVDLLNLIRDLDRVIPR